MPSEVTIEGTMRLATATKNRRSEPLNRLRKARPAVSDSRTVRIITTTPSLSERSNAPLMSTMPPPCHSRSNQWSERPFSGKVRPPVGPWNERMKMTIIGP